jgi:hypothetical protein
MHVDPPVIMPVEAEEGATHFYLSFCVWTFESTRLSVIKNIVSAKLLYIFITAMVLHSIVYHVCVN